jgi:ribosome biogenesis protein Tsr3
MTVLPRNKWAKLFLEWTRELKERHKTMIARDEQELVRVEEQYTV